MSLGPCAIPVNQWWVFPILVSSLLNGCILMNPQIGAWSFFSPMIKGKKIDKEWTNWVFLWYRSYMPVLFNHFEIKVKHWFFYHCYDILRSVFCSFLNLWMWQKWYPVSKTLAEKAAWEFAGKHGIDVVAIHPATCLGELLQPRLNASCAVLQQLLEGSTETQEYHWLGAVHVKDVAKAQVLLFETPAASGRYLCTDGIYQFADFAERVSKLFPEFPVHRSVPWHYFTSVKYCLCY